MNIGGVGRQPITIEFWGENISAVRGVDYAVDPNDPNATGVTDIAIDPQGPSFDYYFATSYNADISATKSFAIHVRAVGHPESEVVWEADIFDGEAGDGS